MGPGEGLVLVPSDAGAASAEKTSSIDWYWCYTCYYNGAGAAPLLILLVVLLVRYRHHELVV